MSIEYLTFLMKYMMPVMDVHMRKKIVHRIASVLAGSMVYSTAAYAHILNDIFEPEMSQFRVAIMDTYRRLCTHLVFLIPPDLGGFMAGIKGVK